MGNRTLIGLLATTISLGAAVGYFGLSNKRNLNDFESAESNIVQQLYGKHQDNFLGIMENIVNGEKIYLSDGEAREVRSFLSAINPESSQTYFDDSIDRTEKRIQELRNGIDFGKRFQKEYETLLVPFNYCHLAATKLSEYERARGVEPIPGFDNSDLEKREFRASEAKHRLGIMYKTGSGPSLNTLKNSSLE
jgi:hypothetical protein